MKISQRSGRLYLWPGAALVLSPGIDSSLHSHFALQLSYGLEQPFRARLSSDQGWTETRSAIFAPHSAHQIDSDGGLLAHLFIELPRNLQTDVTDLQATFGHDAVFLALAATLLAGLAVAPDLAAALSLRQAWQACALPQSLSAAAYDNRVTVALAHIANAGGFDCGGASLAKHVHLSQSRFTHLFRQQTGMSLSRYLLWSRMLSAVAAVAEGNNITTAAHQAGFADLAHMSRTFRTMMGVPPSELHKMAIAFKQDVTG
ncbi:helix-turn-helix transcriptional regulator [Undibacterium sp. TJN19]|uniref:helix-turn-helix transcriptional regulator n=1 Tax=Undibacterium sp. TJN19 TaxID=3413055 RepID=UPI003BF23018